MRRLARSLAPAALLPIAACPPKPPTAPAAAAAPLVGPGCPGAAGVFVASYLAQDPGKGRSGWVLPLSAAPVPATGAPDYQVLDGAAAAAAGVPAPPGGTLWLESDEPLPCRVKLGHVFAAKLPGPPASLSYGVELDGCGSPADPQDGGGIVLVSDAAPTGCRIEEPRPVAGRLGEQDAQQHWSPPARETPVPPALAAIVPPHACTPPACQPLWAVDEVDVDGKPVAWSAAFNWLTVGDPAAQCTWPLERYSGVFVARADGSAVRLDPPGGHAYTIDAALVDARGARVLMAGGPGAYATYDLAPSGATLGHAMTWMLVPDEAWSEVDRLGPRCAPGPAPLPKDAAPVSPYR